ALPMVILKGWKFRIRGPAFGTNGRKSRFHMMSQRLRQAFGMGLFFIFASLVSAGTKDDLSRAKAFLKEHLREIHRKYPFPEWEERVKSARATLESMRNRQALSGPGFDMAAQARMAQLGREAADLSRLR